MIQRSTSQVGTAAEFVEIPCPDFPVTWAGRGRHDNEFCFGAEDGRLRFTTVDGDLIDETRADAEHSDAVNGVAFIGDLMAVSSRQHVVFWKMPHPPETHWQPAPFRCGSHGIIATASGGFIAPLGSNGLMRARALPGQEYVPIDRLRAIDQALDYYKVTSLESNGGELLVCAVRKNGIATIETADCADSPTLNITIHGELDVIDICALATAEAPRAAVGLCRDGTLLFFSDVLDPACRVALRFNEIQGTAYRILRGQNLIIVLTSRGFYFLHGLAERALQRKHAVAAPVPGVIEQIEAIDASLIGECWLLVAMPDAVRRYAVAGIASQFQGARANEVRNFCSIPIMPRITSRVAEAEVTSLSSAA